MSCFSEQTVISKTAKKKKKRGDKEIKKLIALPYLAFAV